MNIKMPLGSRPNLYTKQVARGAFHKKWCPVLHDPGIKTLKNGENKEYKLRAKASTMSIDRDGEIVLPSAFLLDDFLKNPMFLWNHRWWGGIEDSLGHIEDPQVVDDALMATFCYDAAFCERALKCWQKVTISRSIRGFSVGFRMMEWVTASDDEEKINALPPFAAQALRRGDVWLVHTKVALFEISQVLIPSNVDALAEVEEVALLSSSPQTQKQNTERTDEMELNQIAAEMKTIKSSLNSQSENQQKFASALSSVAEATKANAEALEGLKSFFESQKAAPEANQSKSDDSGPVIKTIDDLPQEWVDQIGAKFMEAMANG